MTKKQFLDAVNKIDDKFINELIDVSGDISEKTQENYFVDEQPQKVYLTDKPFPFWKIAVSTAAAVCVLTVGIFAAVKLRTVITTSPSDSGSANLSNVSESPPPIISTIPKINRVADEGYEFNFRIDSGTTERYLSEPVLKNDIENCAVFFINCRGASEENPLRIWILLRENGEIVKRVNSLTITEDGSRYYTVAYDYYNVESGDECVFQVITEGDAHIDGKWLP